MWMSRAPERFEPCPEEEGIKTPPTPNGRTRVPSNPALKKKGLRPQAEAAVRDVEASNPALKKKGLRQVVIYIICNRISLRTLP